MKTKWSLLVLIILNIIILIWCANLFNENLALKKNRAQILYNINGETANWKIADAIEFSDDFSLYVDLGYLEYKGTGIKNLGDFQATLLKDSPDGKVIFSTDTQYNRDLSSGDKLSLGSYKGGILKQEDLIDQRLFLKLSYYADNKEYDETFKIEGNYLEPLDNETSDGNYTLTN